MPVIGISSYNIDFAILENNNPKTLVLLDQSTYLSTPDKPMLFITLPGYTGHIEIPYLPNTIITLNSNTLKLTELDECDSLLDLPDGIYLIKMGVCPYNELFNSKCYLKTSNFDCRFQNILLNFDKFKCLEVEKLKEYILDIDILMQCAKAHTNICDLINATNKYNTALKKLTFLENQLNCK